MTTKFKVGDKVKCVSAEGTAYLRSGNEYTVRAANHSGVKLEEVEKEYEPNHYYDYYRFTPVKAAPGASAAKVSVKGGYLTISYEGVNMTFDTSNEKSRMLVDAVIDTIYGDE